MKKLFLSVLAIVFLTSLTACSESKKVEFKEIQDGKISKSNLYSNEGIGLKVQFPKNWVPLAKDDFPSSLKESENMKPLAVFMNKKISESETQVDYVFQILTVKSTISASDQLYGIKAQAEMLADLNMKTGEVTSYKINGKKLFSLESQILGQGTTTTVVYDAGDYVIQFIGFFKSGNKAKTIETIINSIKIE
jgi:hypothetical protein